MNAYGLTSSIGQWLAPPMFRGSSGYFRATCFFFFSCVIFCNIVIFNSCFFFLYASGAISGKVLAARRHFGYLCFKRTLGSESFTRFKTTSGFSCLRRRTHSEQHPGSRRKMCNGIQKARANLVSLFVPRRTWRAPVTALGN